MSVKKYCYCENNCRYETMSKEEILAAIAQAVETGTVGECDTGFITTIKTINGQPLKFFVGEQSEYDTLTDEQKENLFAIITNDTTKEGLLTKINELIAAAEEQRLFKENILNGNLAVPKAETAEKATTADYIKMKNFVNYQQFFSVNVLKFGEEYEKEFAVGEFEQYFKNGYYIVRIQVHNGSPNELLLGMAEILNISNGLINILNLADRVKLSLQIDTSRIKIKAEHGNEANYTDAVTYALDLTYIGTE